MLKKLTVLAMAVGVVAALALPASASANWKHHSTPIAADTQVGFTGNVRFQGGLGGVECQITSRVKFLTGKTTATAETFVPHPTSDTTNCKGLGGLAFCQIHSLAPQAPNWTIHTGEVTQVITEGGTVHQTIHAKNVLTVLTQSITSSPTGGFCPVNAITLTPGSVTFTPNQPNTVTSAALSGSLQADLTTTGGTVDKETVQTSGTLEIESPNANTYSI